MVVQANEAIAKCKAFSDLYAAGKHLADTAHVAPRFMCGDCACPQCGPLYGARGHVKNAVRTAGELLNDGRAAPHEARLDVIERRGRKLSVCLQDFLAPASEVLHDDLQASWRAWAALVNELGYEVLGWGSGPRYAYYTAFVSYAGEDQADADDLVVRLEARSVSCFIAHRDTAAGVDLEAHLRKRVRWYDHTLALLSPTAVQKSWVRNELALALRWEGTSGRTKLLPLRLCEVEDIAPETWGWQHTTPEGIAETVCRRLILDFRPPARDATVDKILEALAC